ncbi:hypothetical protein DY000_02036579 [Brassica cretica]|uniref:RNase H type-1 domain-containing protein n=1 Tax=Brassica cretica TaxID=69181 RepID=A0ABQ7B591_BRACR|nr:hypothetical protein DY000_02036579 [Brassica cretica]
MNNSIKSAREWSLAQPSTSNAMSNTMPNPHAVPTVQPAGDNCISVFTDAAWRSSHGATGCGWMLQNLDLSVTQHGWKCFNYTPSALTA